MNKKNKTTFRSSLAGAILTLFGKTPTKSTPADLQKAEFKTSAQGMGIRFTEKLRNVFRFRWIKKQ